MDENPQQQTTYVVITNGTQINPKTFERLNNSKSDINRRSSAVYELPLTRKTLKVEQTSQCCRCSGKCC